MQNIVITADSTCDLSPELVEQYGINVLPLYIVMEDKSYKDGLEISPQDIYDYFDRTNETAKTAAASVDDYIQAWTPLVEQGKTVIHLNISSGFSSCHQNARIAAEEVGNVYPIDSKNLSTGIGLLVLRTAELVKEGVEAAEIAEQITALTEKVESSFVIDTLTYLHRGGRCSTVAALGANLLKLKPCIEVQNGGMHVGKKYRGTLKACLESYVADRLNGRDDIDKRRIFITHTSCDKETVDRVRELVTQYGFEEILETTAGCTITSHCGPKTLGILFIRK